MMNGMKKKDFKKVLKDIPPKARVLVVMHDFPDPDSIASALCFSKLVEGLSSASCDITYGGLIGRAENRAMVKELGITLIPFGRVKLEECDVIAMVDTQPGTGNNSLPQGVWPDIVIDHHPLKKETCDCGYYEVREKAGSTSSILYKYYKEFGLADEKHLDTAVYYALRTDTHELYYDVTKDDKELFSQLSRTYDPAIISKIVHARLPRDYYSVLTATLKNAEICDNRILFSNNEVVPYPEIVAETADILVRLERVETVLCAGLFEDSVCLSMRSCKRGIDCGDTIREVVGRIGYSGGHGNMAGGKIELTEKKDYEDILDLVKKRFRKVSGLRLAFSHFL